MWDRASAGLECHFSAAVPHTSRAGDSRESKIRNYKIYTSTLLGPDCLALGLMGCGNYSSRTHTRSPTGRLELPQQQISPVHRTSFGVRENEIARIAMC
jgi:hypothetical protein